MNQSQVQVVKKFQEIFNFTRDVNPNLQFGIRDPPDFHKSSGIRILNFSADSCEESNKVKTCLTFAAFDNHKNVYFKRHVYCINCKKCKFWIQIRGLIENPNPRLKESAEFGSKTATQGICKESEIKNQPIFWQITIPNFKTW